MNPIAPELFLDPLFPLALKRDPVSIPSLGFTTPARGLLVCSEGECTVTTESDRSVIVAPALMPIELRVATLLTRRAFSGWLIVIGVRLLDQLIVGTFGEPGFSRFLDDVGQVGRSPCDTFDKELERVLGDLGSELDGRRPAYRVRALLTNVLLILYRATLVSPAMANGDGLRLSAVLDHIELHSAAELRLAELSALMRVSPSYFSRLFRSEVGMPLFEFINRTRIRKACLLLRQPGLSITTISYEVGYNSVSFFNRYFRRIMNLSPREYRRFLTS